MPDRRDLPSGTVTFLFTDIEASTALVHELGTERFDRVLQDHARIIRQAVSANRGSEVRTEGDPFFVVFRTAREAVARAEGDHLGAQRVLQRGIALLGDLGDRFGLLLTLLLLAATRADLKHAESALRLHGAVEAAFDRSGSASPPPFRNAVSRSIEAARAALPAEAAASAYAAGRAMSIEAAIAYALGLDSGADERVAGTALAGA